MQTEYKYIKFKLVNIKPKTGVWDILTNDGTEEKLGQIKWFPRWGKYSFFPEPCTVFEKTCLNDIISFMVDIEELRKKI